MHSRNKAYVTFIAAILFLLAFDCDGESVRNLLIDSMHYKRPVGRIIDPGTICIYLKNLSDSEVQVENILVNNVSVTDVTAFYWYKVAPNPVVASHISEVLIKPVRPFRERMLIRIVTDAGYTIDTVWEPLAPAFTISYIGFKDDLRSVVVYVQNNGKRELTFRGTYLETQNITDACRIPWQRIEPNSKKCIVANLKPSLQPGQYITFKVDTKEGVSAQARVRAWTYSPIVFEDGSSDPELFMDSSDFRQIPYRVNLALVVKGICVRPSSSIFRILNCPTHDRGTISQSARTVVSRQKAARRADPALLGYVHLCRNFLVESMLWYAGATDIIRINVSTVQLPQVRRYIPENIDIHPVGFLCLLAQKASSPRPFHTVVNLCKDLKREDQDPLAVRQAVYYSILSGSKGIFYRRYHNMPFTKRLRKELKKLNGELQVLKRYLKFADSQGLARCSSEDVKPFVMQAGFDSLLLFVMNRADATRDRGLVSEFSHPDQNANIKISVEIPEGMTIKDVYEVGGTWGRLQFSQDGNCLSICLDEVNNGRQFVLATDRKSYYHDSDMDGISDISEVSRFATHPCISDVQLAP